MICTFCYKAEIDIKEVGEYYCPNCGAKYVVSQVIKDEQGNIVNVIYSAYKV